MPYNVGKIQKVKKLTTLEVEVVSVGMYMLQYVQLAWLCV